MSVRKVIAISVALSVVWASDGWAACRRVILPEIVGVAVFKHYRHDGGEVVDVISNDDVVRYYMTVGSKAKVRKLQFGKVRQAGWVPRNILSQQRLPCVVRQPAGGQQAHSLFDLFQLFFDSFKPL
jgi:hypothetical protein